MLKVLGKGGYAKVLLVKHIETGLIYAMKILKKKFIGKLLKTIDKKNYMHSFTFNFNLSYYFICLIKKKYTNKY
jgi:serine/threonine protein kinase